MSLVELKRYFSPIEAETDRLALQSHGIHAVVFDSGLNYAEGGGLATAARLMVLHDDVDEAAAILAGSASS